MAQSLTHTEARNYPLTTGATADLIALVGTATTEGLTPVSDPAELAVGDVAYVYAMGDLRRGVVTKLTKTKIHVTLTTPAAAALGGSVRVQTTVAGLVYVKKAPAAPVEIEETPEVETPAALDTSSELAQSLIEADHTEALAENETSSPEADEEPETECGRCGGPLASDGACADDSCDEEHPECAAKGCDIPEGLGECRVCGAELIEIDQPEELTLNSHDGKVGLNSKNETEEPDMASTETQSVTRELTGSSVVRLLERVHARIRQNHPEVPEVVIVTGAGIGFGGGKWGHFRPQGWTAQNEGDKATHIHEMFMAGETLAKGSRQVLQTMIHESAHALAEHRGEKDTSRQGRWHNQVFRKTAQELGLEYKGEKADKTLGFSQVTLTAETVEEYKDLLDALDAEIHLMVRLPGWLGGTAGSDEDGEDEGGENMGKAPKTGPATNSNNSKLTCECEEPNIIRASKKVAAKMVVRCDDCEALFAERD